jgi:hypothetical protein
MNSTDIEQIVKEKYGQAVLEKNPVRAVAAALRAAAVP